MWCKNGRMLPTGQRYAPPLVTKYSQSGPKVVSKLVQSSLKGAGAFHSASQSKEGSVGFDTSQLPILMKLLPDHLWH